MHPYSNLLFGHNHQPIQKSPSLRKHAESVRSILASDENAQFVESLIQALHRKLEYPHLSIHQIGAIRE